jgi:hypothetical protein
MTTTQITLETNSHPLMMHLSITPHHQLISDVPDYDPHSQTANTSAMNEPWCVENSSTGRLDGSVG